MIGRRNWALRLSVVLNVCVLLYVCAHFRVSSPWVEEGIANYGAQAQVEIAYGRPNATGPNSPRKFNISSVVSSISSFFVPPSAPEDKSPEKVRTTLAKAANETEAKTQYRNETEQQKTTPTTAAPLKLEETIKCWDKFPEPKTGQRGDYWVLYNYVPMSKSVRCWETVTYTTHADYTFLDNLEPLLEKWRAPISVALHAPGTDFAPTLEAIKYLRNCASPLVTQLVTFHVYFSAKHIPKNIPRSGDVAKMKFNCTLKPPWVNASVAKMYKSEKKLLYPVNVGRNIARESSLTHYILASDIELYPSPGLATKFLEMIRRKKEQPVLQRPNPKVFVLSIFEVNITNTHPESKTILQSMLKNESAIPFHKKVCAGCHNIPKSKEWQKLPETKGLHVFHVGKRTGSFSHWEPIFIGTNNDPLYDERLSWEGKSDKMTQGYTLCVMDYDFLILDNAYLVHRPGIKIYKKDHHRDLLTGKTNLLIKKVISPELELLYGKRAGCVI